MKRRKLLKAAANDRIGIGMIGVGGFGLGSNLPDFMKNPDVDVVAICDVDQSNLDKAVSLVSAPKGGKPKPYRDFASCWPIAMWTRSSLRRPNTGTRSCASMRATPARMCTSRSRRRRITSAMAG